MKTFSSIGDVLEVVKPLSKILGIEESCAGAASAVVELIGGEVWGYSKYLNMSAQLDLGQAAGHHFVLLNGRWLIDVWAHVAMKYPMVYDLLNDLDRKSVGWLYGDSSKWERSNHQPRRKAHG